MVVLLTITKTFHIRHAAGNPTPFPPLRSVRAVVFIAREQSSAFFYSSEANCTKELIVVLLLSFFGLPSSIARRRPLAPSLGWPCLGPPSSSIARRRPLARAVGPLSLAPSIARRRSYNYHINNMIISHHNNHRCDALLSLVAGVTAAVVGT